VSFSTRSTFYSLASMPAASRRPPSGDGEPRQFESSPSARDPSSRRRLPAFTSLWSVTAPPPLLIFGKTRCEQESTEGTEGGCPIQAFWYQTSGDRMLGSSVFLFDGGSQRGTNCSVISVTSCSNLNPIQGACVHTVIQNNQLQQLVRVAPPPLWFFGRQDVNRSQQRERRVAVPFKRSSTRLRRDRMFGSFGFCLSEAINEESIALLSLLPRVQIWTRSNA
jgi:hypothetical protein